MVEFLRGKRELISFSDFEASYGASTSPSVLLGRNAKWTPNNSNELEEIKGSGTDSILVDTREYGVKSVGGTLNFVPQNWKFLKFVLLADSSGVTDTDNGSYYTHTFTNDKTVGSFNLERAIKHSSNDRVRTYDGCQVNRFGLTFDTRAGGFVNCNLDIKARDVENGTSATSLTALSDDGFKSRQATINIDGSAETKVTSGSLNVENNLDEGRYGDYDNSNRLKSESAVNVRKVNGSFTINLTDDTYYDLWEATNKVSGTCSLKLTRGTNDDVTFTFTDVYINDAPDPTNFDGPNNVTLNFVAKDLGVVVNDGESDYGTFS